MVVVVVVVVVVVAVVLGIVVVVVGVVVVVVAAEVDDFLNLRCGFWRSSDKPPVAELGSHNVRWAKAISLCHHDRAGAAPSSSPSSPSSPPASSFGVEVEEEGPAAAGDSGAALTVGWLISNHLQKLGTGCPKNGRSRSLGTPSLPPVPASLGGAGAGGVWLFLLVVVAVVVVGVVGVVVVVVVGGVAVSGCAVKPNTLGLFSLPPGAGNTVPGPLPTGVNTRLPSSTPGYPPRLLGKPSG